jgi:hypothetical protein
LLLSKFPSFDPTWPNDVQIKWFEAFDELLKRGFDPNTVSESGQVPLYLAMQEDCPKVATVLLSSVMTHVDFDERTHASRG